MKVETGFEAGVFTITLADQENRNALSSAMVGELHDALDEVDRRLDVRVVVVTNRGRVFCAGRDLSEQTDGTVPADEDDPSRVFARILRSPKPFVGRIAGHAVAGGTGLVAAMDLSVAVDDAKFGFTEVRLGLAPAIISTICLPKMRRSEALEAMLRGRRFDATEAARLGIINHAVPAEQLDAAVEEIVGDLLLGGPNALAATKALFGFDDEFEERISEMGRLSAALFQSEEGQEGMRAYLEKRPPDWAG